MEVLEGQTLHGMMMAGELPVQTVVDFAIQIAEGLRVAHARYALLREALEGTKLSLSLVRVKSSGCKA